MNDGNYAGYLKRASQLDAHQWRYGKLLINHFIENKNYSDALLTAKQYHEQFPQHFRINMLLAKTLLMQALHQMQSKNYTSALSSIRTAHLWPKNLGVGKPYEEDIDA
jgi:hypothetical protein